MLKNLHAIVCVLIFSFASQAQISPTGLKYLGVDDGLSNNVVNSIYRDRFGFMWMGTYDGLNRYDGYGFKIFRNQWNNEQSLINNHITALNGDRQDRIWIGTQKGASVYDYADSRIHSVTYLDKGKEVKLTAPVNSITIGQQGWVYLATDNQGLFVIKGRKLLAERIMLLNSPRFTARALSTDQHHVVWLYIKDIGLCYYRPENQSIRIFNRNINSVTSILPLDDTLWLGTEHGLYVLNTKTNMLVKAAFKLSSDNIMNLSQDKSKKLWIATDGGGVDIADLTTGRVVNLKAGKEKGSLTSNSVAVVYEDPELRKWIATLRGGVNIIDLKDKQFKTIENDPFQKNTLVNNFVLSFAEDANHNIWIGTDGGGLSIWNPRLNQYTNFVHHPEQPYSLVSNFITSMLKDDQNNMWVASFNGGIDRFDPATGKFKHYSCYNPYKKETDVNLWKLYQDQQHQLWAGTTKGGALYRLNRSTDKFELFDPALTDVHCIYQDKQGVLWGGTYTNLIRIDQVNKKHQYIPVKMAIRAIIQGRDGYLWIGTEGGGLLRFDKKTGTFQRYIEANGLPSNSILNILEDETGDLWCSTYNGLSKFNPVTSKFKNYFATDGLQSNQFNYNAAFKLSSGELLFGGINGFNKFYPDSIRANKRIPPIVLTDFRVNNVSIGQGKNDQPSTIVNLSKIQIPFDAAVISVDFAAIEYSFQDQIKYAYYLEGWDRDWNDVDKTNTAYYSRLDEGSYKLHIKSTDTEGIWSNNEKIILIKILPPWYRTWWAYTLYLLAASAMYYLFWSYRRRQSHLKREIELTNLKMEREKELNEKKLNFFTNISHELRTPLTLIVNPIKDILRTKEPGPEKNDLNVVYRNSRRLLSLVDQLLLFRRTESETESLKVARINLSAFAKEIFLCFSYLAKQNHIDYVFKCEEENLFIFADRDKLEIILFNLLSNALKFTPKGGYVYLHIEDQGDLVNLQVKDSGSGIPEEVGEKLFDKFYKVMNSTSRKIGFGIGLYLVKNFVELHQGKITYSTKQGEGTTFYISLPKGEEQESFHYATPENELVYVNELIAEEEREEERKDLQQTGNLELMISDLHTILVVDDNEQIIDYIDQIFQQKFKIYRAQNGLEGLQLSKQILPDIIISDVNMEGLNGIELCKAIKEDQSLSHIPVILLTANPSPELKLQGIEVGAYDFISKPFDKELFMAKINGIIKNRKDLQSYFYNEITLKSETHKVSQEDSSFLQKCIAIIEENLIENEFNVKSLASDLGMSHSNLYKKVKSTSGLSINSFIRFIRLRKAAELLINTNLNINEAAFRVGINDIKYFREQFQKQFKLTPSEFVKKHRKTFHKNYNIHTNNQ